MRQPKLPPVTSLQGWQDFSPHLGAILSMQVSIREAAFAFDSLYGRDTLRAAQCLAIVQVKVFTDLAAQVRQSMRPFVRVNREVYSYIEDEMMDGDAIFKVESTAPEVPRETKLPRLSAREELGGFTYHLCGILDAIDDVREAADEFVAKCGVDDDEATTVLARLQVELFVHLAYHVKELVPFMVALNSEIYAKLREQYGQAEKNQVE